MAAAAAATAQPQAEHALPSGVLEAILGQLDQAELLGCAALVSQRWRAAALAVVSERGVRVAFSSSRSSGWLCKHGGRLRALVIGSGQLRGACLQHLSCLTRLEVRHTLSSIELLDDLAALQGLRCLDLESLDWGPLISLADRARMAAAASRVWQALGSPRAGLTHLSVARCDLDDAAVRQLTCQLSGLAHLGLRANQLKSGSALAPLPRGLTALDISFNHANFDVSELLGAQPPRVAGGGPSEPSTEPGSGPGSGAELPALQRLSVSGVTLSQPWQLVRLAGSLTHLEASGLAAPPEQLLTALQQLTALRQLELRNSFTQAHRSIVDCDLLEAALQPLQALTYLDISCNQLRWEEQPHGQLQQPPAGAAAAAQAQAAPFLSAVRLPHLRVLLAASLCGEPQLHLVTRRRLGDRELQQLVRSCPALCSLEIVASLDESVAAAGLAALCSLRGSLTNLALGGGGWAPDDAVLHTLAQLSGLVRLVLEEAGPGVADEGIIQLTALSGLTALRLSGLVAPGVCEALLPRGGLNVLSLSTKLGGRHSGSVQQQLLVRCCKSPAFLQQRQEQLEQELRAAKREARDAKKAAAKHAKKAAAAQREAKAAQEELAALRQQLAELQAAGAQQQAA